MQVQRNRTTSLVLIIITMLLGLSSRQYSTYIPDSITLYLGDSLWALMIFFVFGFLFKNRKTKDIALFAFIFSFGIELTQIYHAPWIDTLRETWLGGLVLGYGFLWSDLLSYSVGILIGIIIEKYISA